MSRRQLIVVIALAGLGVAVLAVGLRGSGTAAQPAAGPTESSLIPDFTPAAAPVVKGTTLAGRPLDLASFRGRTVVLNFWASWCGPCRRELPAIAAFAKAHPEVQVVGISYQDDVGEAKAFAKQAGATWPSIVDDGPIGSGFKVPGLPATFIIDPAGTVTYRLLGEVTEQQLVELVTPRAAS